MDIHQEFYVVAAQHDHATPQPARRFRPEEFVAWVGRLRARLVVYRPLLAVLDEQIAALTMELAKAAASGLPAGLGKLTSVVVCWEV